MSMKYERLPLGEAWLRETDVLGTVYIVTNTRPRGVHIVPEKAPVQHWASW